MTMKTDITNRTKQSIELKEGNAGAYRFLKQLDVGAKISIKVDTNATYREYMVATGKKGETVFLTSDDFSEYKVIDIEEDPGKDPGIVIYKSVPRNPGNPGSTRPPERSNVGGVGSKSNTEGGSNAGVGSDPPASLAAGAGSDPPATSAAGAESEPPASSAAEAGSVPPASSAGAVGSVPPASSVAGAGSDPPASSVTGAGSDPPALPVASSETASGSSNQNVSWSKKLKSRFKWH